MALEVSVAREGGLTITGGILTIVAASLSLIIAYSAIFLWHIDFLYRIVTWWLGIAGFAFGLASGVLMIKKKSLIMALVGMVILLIVGILPLLWGFIYPVEFLRPYWMDIFYFYGIPIIVFVALSIIFTVASRKKVT